MKSMNEAKKAILINKLQNVINSAVTVDQLEVSRKFAQIAIQKSPFSDMKKSMDIIVEEWVRQRLEAIQKTYDKECA